MKPTPEDIAEVLASIAPEVDPASIDRGADIVSQLDIDSMDFLEFVVALAKRYHVDIPEADYPQLATINECLEYLDRKTSPPR